MSHGPDKATPDERERQTKALELRIAGATYDQIAKTLKYADRTGAFRAVDAVLKRRESTAAAEYRELEDSRLDLALRKVAPGVVAGDLKAIELWLRIHDRRVKLHGLAMPEKLQVQSVGLDHEAFTTTVDEDMRLLGLRPETGRPLSEPELIEDDGEPWANTGDLLPGARPPLPAADNQTGQPNPAAPLPDQTPVRAPATPSRGTRWDASVDGRRLTWSDVLG
ncbi:hypothetical protein ABZ552_05615 [Nocardia sp. NPDC019219]|uniref:hypothetical protein n=1 Tax=Nocardia sp. NPDC019219 TaxID=3154590 RepID=UPI0033FDE406